MIPLFRQRSPEPSGSSPDARAERIDDVMVRVAEELRSVRGPMTQDEIDAMAHDIVLDVARFVLQWVEDDARDAMERDRVAAHAVTGARLAIVGSPDRLAV